MIKLFELIKKNFKLLVRADASALVIFIGPLLLVTLIGLAFSQSSSFMLTSSVYSSQYSPLSESLINKMENQNFRVIKEDSLDNCIGSVKRRGSQACIVFPNNMNVDGDNEISFYVDYSQVNLVWLMLDIMSARVSERSAEISKERTADLLNRIWYVEERANTGKQKLNSAASLAGIISNSSKSARDGISQLDISVDFNIDTVGIKDNSQKASFILTDINAMTTILYDNTSKYIKNIDDALSDIESASNKSIVHDGADDIDDAATDVKDLTRQMMLAVSMEVAKASLNLDSINEKATTAETSLSAAQNHISNVKDKRDRLIPELESVSSNMDSLLTDIDSVNLGLDEALKKIRDVKGRNADSISAPITTKIQPISAQKTHFNSLFPGLLVMIIMISGILLSATLVMVEKKSKALFRNSFTPTSFISFDISTYITSLVVLFIQLILFVSVSAFFFETEVLVSLWLVILIIFLTATAFIFIGMLVGAMLKTDETMNLAAITLISLFLLFSSTIIPLESLPGIIKQISLFNPFVISETILSQVIIFQFGFFKVFWPLCTLAMYSVGSFLLLILGQYSLRRISLVNFGRVKMGEEKKGSAKITGNNDDNEFPDV